MKIFVWKNDFDPDHLAVIGIGETAEDARKMISLEIDRAARSSSSARYMGQLAELFDDIERAPDEVLKSAFLVERPD